MLFLMNTGKVSMISKEEFLSAVFSFDIWQNDISIVFTAYLIYPQVLDRIPSIFEDQGLYSGK